MPSKLIHYLKSNLNKFQSNRFNTRAALLWSYPKSGNTLLRQLLCSYIWQNEIKPLFAIPTLFKELENTPIEFQTNTSTTYMIKTHLNPTNKLFKIDAKSVSHIIYIYRDLEDIFLSSLNYAFIVKTNSIFIDQTPKTVEQIIIDGEIEHYINTFCQSGGWHNSQSGNIFKYEKEIKNYAGENQIPMINISYEQLISETRNLLIEVIEFLDLPIEEWRLNYSLSETESKTRRNGKFFWKSRSKNAEKMLNHQQINYLRKSIQLAQDKYND